MKITTKKQIYALIILIVLATSAGCGSMSNQTGVTLTITEEQVLRHMHQRPVTTRQQIQNGDIIVLEDFGRVEWEITIIEIRENSVIVHFEPPLTFSDTSSETEIAFGEKIEVMTPSLSSWAVWTLSFSSR